MSESLHGFLQKLTTTTAGNLTWVTMQGGYLELGTSEVRELSNVIEPLTIQGFPNNFDTVKDLQGVHYHQKIYCGEWGFCYLMLEDFVHEDFYPDENAVHPEIETHQDGSSFTVTLNYPEQDCVYSRTRATIEGMQRTFKVIFEDDLEKYRWVLGHS